MQGRTTSGIRYVVHKAYVKVDLGRNNAKVLSSAVQNGGLVRARSVINFHVPPNYNGVPEKTIRRMLGRYDLDRDSVVLMTAANTSNLVVKEESFGNSNLCVFCTAGVSNSQSSGDPLATLSRESKKTCSTINIIIVLKANVSDNCLANMIITATEAKSRALRELDVRSKSSFRLATGTTTDSVAVACIGGRDDHTYAGTGTELGFHLGHAVKEAVTEAIGLQDNLLKSRSLVARLAERGISLEELSEAALNKVVGVDNSQRERLRVRAKQVITEATTDPNVCALILAAMELEDAGQSGLIPNLSELQYGQDPINLVADEDLGEMISRFIAGTMGIHNFRFYDRFKPGILSRLGPFLDDAMCGLIGGAMSKLFSEEIEREAKGVKK